MAGEIMTRPHPPGFVWTLLEPQFFFFPSFILKNHLKNDNIPLHRRRWKVIAKMTLSWKLRGGGVSLLSAGLSAQNICFFFLLKRTMIISELRGSPGCGCLPSAASYRERASPLPHPQPNPRLWKLQRTSKTLWPVISSMNGHWKATTGRELWTQNVEMWELLLLLCGVSKLNPLEGWDRSWQMSKSWPQHDCLNYNTYTDVWSDDTKRLIKVQRCFSLHVKKVSCKEQMWIF